MNKVDFGFGVELDIGEEKTILRNEGEEVETWKMRI